MLSKCDYNGLKFKNECLTQLYDGKKETLNSNLSKLNEVDQNLQSLKVKLFQSENINNMINEDLLSWDFQIDFFRKSFTKIDFDDVLTKNQKIVNLFFKF